MSTGSETVESMLMHYYALSITLETMAVSPVSVFLQMYDKNRKFFIVLKVATAYRGIFDMPSSIEPVLESLGLSKNESKVYSALAALGSSPVGKIASKAQMHRANAYDALQRLVEKGLAAHLQKGQTKYFEVTGPENLRLLLKAKELELEAVLPQLILSKRMTEPETSVQIYEGYPALRNALMECLSFNQPVYIIGTPRHAFTMAKPTIDNFIKQRIERKIQAFKIYNDELADIGKRHNKLPFTEVRCLPKELSMPMAMTISGDVVHLKVWEDQPLGVRIKSKKIAAAYINYFKVLWEVSHKP